MATGTSTRAIRPTSSRGVGVLATSRLERACFVTRSTQDPTFEIDADRRGIYVRRQLEDARDANALPEIRQNATR
jgi:hypothetical protein